MVTFALSAKQNKLGLCGWIQSANQQTPFCSAKEWIEGNGPPLLTRSGYADDLG